MDRLLPIHRLDTQPGTGSRVKVQKAFIEAAGKAFRTTRFFGLLYEREPACAAEIPFISESDYHRSAGLLDCVTDRTAIIGIMPPYWRDTSRLPVAVPEDEAELSLRQKRIVRAMNHLGVRFEKSPRFLIIADGRRGPFAAELAKGFYWEGFQTSICFHDGTGQDLRREVAAHEPDFVLMTSSRHQRHVLERPRDSVWIVESCSHSPIEDPSYPSLIFADGVDLIGSRRAGVPEYDYDDEQLLIEVNPTSGLSYITKLQFTCFPLIRFNLGRHLLIPYTSRMEES